MGIQVEHSGQDEVECEANLHQRILHLVLLFLQKFDDGSEYNISYFKAEIFQQRWKIEIL